MKIKDILPNLCSFSSNTYVGIQRIILIKPHTLLLTVTYLSPFRARHCCRYCFGKGVCPSFWHIFTCITFKNVPPPFRQQRPICQFEVSLVIVHIVLIFDKTTFAYSACIGLGPSEPRLLPDAVSNIIFSGLATLDFNFTYVWAFIILILLDVAGIHLNICFA